MLKKTAGKASHKRLVYDEEEEFMLGNNKKQKMDAKKSEIDKLVMMKDNPYTIFHALGKFLYNKSKRV